MDAPQKHQRERRGLEYPASGKIEVGRQSEKETDAQKKGMLARMSEPRRSGTKPSRPADHGRSPPERARKRPEGQDGPNPPKRPKVLPIWGGWMYKARAYSRYITQFLFLAGIAHAYARRFDGS